MSLLRIVNLNKSKEIFKSKLKVDKLITGNHLKTQMSGGLGGISVI